jgi:Flp pilus assembly protein TadD
MSQAIGERSTEIQALNHLGDVSLATGDRGQARRPLALASMPGKPYEQARAHDGLARAYHTAADHEQARHHWPLCAGDGRPRG